MTLPDPGRNRGLDAHQFVGRDRLDLGNDNVGSLLLDQGAQGHRIRHANYVGVMRHVMTGHVCIAVNSDHLDV